MQVELTSYPSNRPDASDHGQAINHKKPGILERCRASAFQSITRNGLKDRTSALRKMPDFERNELQQRFQQHADFPHFERAVGPVQQFGKNLDRQHAGQVVSPQLGDDSAVIEFP